MTQAFIKITTNDPHFGTQVFYAVWAEMVDGGIRFAAGGHGYWVKAEHVVRIEPYYVD